MPELLAHYPFTDTAYHELLDRQGGVRPHWQRLFRQLERSSPEQLRQRQALVERQIQENGVTYNVYADPKGTDRPWALDLLPNLLSAAEWQPIAAGVAQRARLLNALLADLYGDQRLLAEGLLPSELVFGHPNFLWPALGIRRPAGFSCTAMPWTWRAMPTDAGRSCRPHPGSVRRGLCAGEPADRLAGLAGTLSRPARAASRRVFPHLQETSPARPPATARRRWWCC